VDGSTAGFTEDDPHRMLYMRDLDEGLIWLADVASTCGQVSIDATRCKGSVEERETF
jgi:hypothetical protein